MSRITSVDAVRASDAFKRLSPADQEEVATVLKDATPEQLSSYFGRRGVSRDELRDLLSDKTPKATPSNPYFTPKLVEPRPMFATLTANVMCKTDYVHARDFDITEIVPERISPDDTATYNCEKGRIRETVKAAVEAQTGRHVKAVFGADGVTSDALARGIADGDGTLRLPVRVVFKR